jgi:SAM-dependent methyltransferase
VVVAGSGTVSPEPSPWNHNIHYHPLILGAVPPGCQRGLDVGCGEGLLARELRQVVPHVVAIDSDGPVIGRARQQDAGFGVEYVTGDFLGYGFAAESFDVIVSVAALHHMDPAAALRRMRELLRPEGILAVVGLARSRARDLPADALGVIAHRFLLVGKSYEQVNAPIIWPPPQTYAQVRRIAGEVLPGARYRRHLLWRYSLTWTKPAP